MKFADKSEWNDEYFPPDVSGGSGGFAFIKPPFPPSPRGKFLPTTIIFYIFLSTILLLYGCKVKYSFTGASVPADAKTISIQYFPNNSSSGPGTLSAQFTEDLKDRFTSRTNLKLVETPGDLSFEGYISTYSVGPVGITGNETVSLNRLTLSVYVKFTNSKDEKLNFETTFSRFADYDSQLQLTSIEEELIKQINTQLVDDIFNKAVVNW